MMSQHGSTGEGASLTLRELLQTPAGDGNSSPNDHRHILDLYDHDPFPSSPFPFVLSFHNLFYAVKVRRRGVRASPEGNVKVLLDGVSGEAREGEIMAVLGASGAGKSTLIDALAGRISRGSLGGTVTMNGEVLESKLLKAISAYVMQDDLLFPMLTVEETLMFAAEFRLPRTLPHSGKKERVGALIEQLGLKAAAKTVIGDESHRGISGGERRRVSIGTDIIHDPVVLFLDEPTTGLDSTSANMVVKVLQRIAKSGSIVIMTVHQPSYRILSLLDRLIFLSKGLTVFNGSPSSLPTFFQDFGNPVPKNENVCEFALDFIRELEQSPQGTRNLVEFNKSWQSTSLSNMVNANNVVPKPPPLKEAIRASISKGKLVTNSDSNGNVQKFANPVWVEMTVIGKRSLVNAVRMPELFGMRFGAVIVTGVILATIFWKLDDSPKGVQERLGFFAFAMSTTFYTCADAIPVFLQERDIFMRETSHNAYRRSSYVLAHSIISLPSLAFLSIAFATTTYWAVGLAGGIPGFFFFLLFIFASFWAGSSFVTFLSGVIYNVMVGYTVVVAILAYFVLFSGFFISRDRIPPYWIWFHYASLVKYPFQGVLQNEFGDSKRCFVKGVEIFEGSPLNGVPKEMKLRLLEKMSETLGMNITASTCLTNGSDILKQSGLTDLDKWSCLWVTIAWGIFFRVLFYFTLLVGSKNKRK